MVLTLNCVRLAVASRHVVRFATVVGLSIVTLAMIRGTAHADGIVLGGCVGAPGSVNCVVRWGEAGDPYIRVVPQPTDDAERTRSAERDRKWQRRCRPTIAHPRADVAHYG